MYKINLIGDIDASGGENTINYNTLTAELDNANGQDLEITINTLGGHVDEAFKIYDALEQYKIDNKAVITTITDEECASSGVILLLAGNRRIVNNNSMPFVHNAMYVDVTANAKELEYLANNLKECDNRIAELYARKTALSVEEALNLMDNDTSLTPEESYSLGFATELSKIYNQKVKNPKLIIQNKLNKNMSKEQTFFELAKNFFLGLDKEEKQAIQNKVELTVSDAELDFYELDSDATPSIGDKAQFEGKPAEGDFKMKKGVEYKFEAGVLKEIEEEKEEEIVIIEEENELQNQLNESLSTIENLKSEKEVLALEIQNLKTELESKNSTIEKYNKLESQFLAENKKEQRESTEVEEKKATDWSALKNNLKKIK